jgi:hypothetical protein
MSESTVLVIPDTDALGVPTAPHEVIRSQWAVLIDTVVGGVAGPHMFPGQDEDSARIRLAWWLENRPDANPKLIRQEITESYGEWKEAR